MAEATSLNFADADSRFAGDSLSWCVSRSNPTPLGGLLASNRNQSPDSSESTGGHRHAVMGESICGTEQHVRVEAAVVSGMAGTAGLIDGQQYRVAVTVQPYRVHVLGVPRGGTLDPLFVS